MCFIFGICSLSSRDVFTHECLCVVGICSHLLSLLRPEVSTDLRHCVKAPKFALLEFIPAVVPPIHSRKPHPLVHWITFVLWVVDHDARKGVENLAEMAVAEMVGLTDKRRNLAARWA